MNILISAHLQISLFFNIMKDIYQIVLSVTSSGQYGSTLLSYTLLKINNNNNKTFNKFMWHSWSRNVWSQEFRNSCNTVAPDSLEQVWIHSTWLTTYTLNPFTLACLCNQWSKRSRSLVWSMNHPLRMLVSSHWLQREPRAAGLWLWELQLGVWSSLRHESGLGCWIRARNSTACL